MAHASEGLSAWLGDGQTRGVEVGEAILENGLLHVDLSQTVPDTVMQKIEIKKG